MDDLFELTTTRDAFYGPFSKSNAGPERFETVTQARKYIVQRKDGKDGARPSASIVQLTFKNDQEATDWFDVYDESPMKIVVQSKPKTELWQYRIHVYFIQTYHTPTRHYLDLLKETLTSKIES